MQIIKFLLLILGLIFLVLGLFAAVISSQPAAQLQGGLIFIGSAIIVAGILIADAITGKK